MSDYGGYDDNPDERLIQEAEEFMRQGRYQDAISRYREMRRQSPTDLFASLGHISALECAGEVQEAEKILQEVGSSHNRSPHLQRFMHLFFERREDIRRAARCRQAARDIAGLGEGPVDQLADMYFNQGRYHEALAELYRIQREEEIDSDEIRSSILARLGACQRQQGQYSEAKKNLHQAIQLDESNHWTYAELAELERANGNGGEAREHYDQALKLNPDDQWCRGHLAQLEHELGHSERAVELYEEVLNAQPETTWALVELAQIIASDDPQRSEDLCRQALDKDPAYPWAYAQIGALQRSAGKMEAANKSYKEALQCSPTATWIMHELADTARQMGRMQEAYTHLEHAQNINSFDSTTYGYMADLLRSEGRSNEAIQNLRKAVELDSNYTWAWRELAELEALAGHYDEADSAYENAASQEPSEAINDGLKAFILRCQDKRAAAESYLLRAIHLQADYFWAWRELIEYYITANRYDDAERYAQQALEQFQEHPHFLIMLAEAKRQQGDQESARAIATRASEADPDNAQAWAILAELSMQVDLNEAARYAERAARLEDQHECHLLVAQIYLQAGNYSRANRAIEQAMEHKNCPPVAWDMAAEIAQRRGNVNDANNFCRRGLQRFPDNPRLQVRRALSIQRSGKKADNHKLRQLVDDGFVSRDLTQLFIQAGDHHYARQCCFHLVAHADADDLPHALVFQAETELALGNIPAALTCLHRALALDKQLFGARLLLAMIAQQSGDLDAAQNQLERAQELESSNKHIRHYETEVVLRQLAEVHESKNNKEQAEQCWRQLIEHEDSDNYSERVCGLARFLSRQERYDEAMTLLEQGLSKHEDEQEEDHQRYVHELALVHFQNNDSETAFCILGERTYLHPKNCLLLAQLALADDKLDSAEEALDRLLSMNTEAELNRAARLLLARTHLARKTWSQAEPIARELLTASKNKDEEAANILGQCLAFQGQYEEALGILTDSALPTEADSERALIVCSLLLETQGVEAAARWAGQQHKNFRPSIPMVRALASTWPHLFTFTTPPEFDLEDLSSLPAFPRMSQAIAHALIKQGKDEAAAHVCIQVAASLERSGAIMSAKELLAIAVLPLKRLGLHRKAWQAAMASGSWRRIIRSCMPY